MAGTLAVMAAAVLWAGGASLASRLFDRGLTPVELTGARAWIAALGFLLIARRARPAQRRELAIPLGLAIAAANFFYYFAVSRIAVAIALVIQYTAPGLVVLWAALVDRVKPARATVAALALATGGVALIAGAPDESYADALGFAAAAASALGFAAYMILGERVGRDTPPARALLHAFTVSGILWTIVLVARAEPPVFARADILPGVLAIGIGATLAPFLLFLWGMNRIGSSSAGIVSTLEPVAGALIAFLWLGQELQPWQVAGGALVVVGIGFVHATRPRSEQTPVPP